MKLADFESIGGGGVLQRNSTATSLPALYIEVKCCESDERSHMEALILFTFHLERKEGFNPEKG